MKESMGYTATLNIIIIFITIVFAFLFAIFVYFRANLANKIVISEIEECEGYNKCSSANINARLARLGYNTGKVKCPNEVSDNDAVGKKCELVSMIDARGENGYCVYLCDEDGTDYYYYKIDTRMRFNFPIINDLITLPIYATTNRLYSYGF